MSIFTSKKTKLVSRILCCASSIALISSGALAQVVEPTPADDSATERKIDEVIVTGIRAAAQSQRDAKRNATGITDSIFASDFLDTADQNVAEALQRMTGIGIDRTDGEGSHVTVRGVDPSLNKVTLNGQSLSNGGDGSDDGGVRNQNGADFSTISAALIDAIEVIKSPSAKHDEGSLGGTVNLRTKKPLSFKDRLISGEVRLQRNSLADKNDFAVNLGLADKYFGDKFGISVGLTYDGQSTRTDEYSSFDRYRALANLPAASLSPDQGFTSTDPFTADAPEFAGYFLKLSERKRIGGTLGLQLQPNDKTDLWADIAYSELTRDFIIHQKRLNGFNARSAVDGSVIVNDSGDILAAQFGRANGIQISRSQEVLTKTTTLSVGASREFGDNWTAEVNLGFSEADRSEPDNKRVNFTLIDRVNAAGGFSYLGENGDLLDFPTITFGPGHEVSGENFRLGVVFEDDRTVTDKDFSQSLDVTREINGNFIKDISAGIKFTAHETTRSTARRVDRLGGSGPEATEPGISNPFPVDDFFDGISDSPIEGWLLPNFDTVFADNVSDNPLEINRSNTYQIEQDTKAAYIMANYELLDGRLSGDFGVRFVETDIESTGAAGINFPNGQIFSPLTVSHSYTNTLPSMNAKYSLTDDVLLRFAAAKVMARPAFDQLRPGLSISHTNFEVSPTGNGGNPRLNPTTANQFDLSAEWYFGDSGLLSATAFYKDITSFIFRQSFEVTDIPDTANSSSGILLDSSTCADPVNDPFNASACNVANVLATAPLNGQGGKIQGLELSYQQNYDFLPGLLQHLGAIVNYTYTDSEATFFADENNLDGGTVYEGFPFPSTSRHTFNTTAYWENDNWSLKAAYNLRSKRLISPALRGFATWADKRDTLDASVSYTIIPGTTIKLEGVNLTNESQREFATRVLDNGDLLGEGSAFDGAPTFRTSKFTNNGRIFRVGVKSKF